MELNEGDDVLKTESEDDSTVTGLGDELLTRREDALLTEEALREDEVGEEVANRVVLDTEDCDCLGQSVIEAAHELGYSESASLKAQKKLTLRVAKKLRLHC
ncbi:hypothetical protein N0V93_009008 [Gnomoniopsis smithogilvyi]|uniref:Uncharacterized protein n=1 Tax=Gnomoniopsis smithogilvyi TaxID=1191159 RepID=A0A9W8YKA3_9PEZI|nr:hypothetical protein N0V93_009008 [Gnomoniopsis smithogilvyi]